MLKPESQWDIPEQTKTVATAAFPKGSLFMKMRDEFGFLFTDEQFVGLYSTTGQPAEGPARLAMITIMQFAENLTDRQAADAVRGRIDWKYALGLELTDAGFHYSVLSEFRQRLVEGNQAQVLLGKMLEKCIAKGYLKGKKQRTDSTHILASIRALNLVELVGETMRSVLDELAKVASTWLEVRIRPEWLKRYGRRFDSYRLPKTKEKREELAKEIGKDGHDLLAGLFETDTPNELRYLPQVERMRQIWVQQYYKDENGVIRWRTKKKWGQPPAAKMIASQRDLEAKYCVKRQTEWTGYKVHLTETCEDDSPHLITQVSTTPATVHDVKLTEQIQDSLIEKGLKPETHLVDEGYMETDVLVSSQDKGIDLVGPMPSSKSWQDKDEDAFDHTQFHIDWENGIATCPNGKQSFPCSNRKTWRGTLNLMFTFKKEDCFACEMRQRCSKAKSNGRTLTIYPQKEYEALLKARERQKSEEFKQLYNARAGIEGTISQGIRKTRLRQSRFIGLQKTHLQHVALATAINMMRLFDWLNGERPKSVQRSSFQALAGQFA